MDKGITTAESILIWNVIESHSKVCPRILPNLESRGWDDLCNLQFCSSTAPWAAAAHTDLHLFSWVCGFSVTRTALQKQQDEGGGSWQCFHFLEVLSRFQKPREQIWQFADLLPSLDLQIVLWIGQLCWPSVIYMQPKQFPSNFGSVLSPLLLDIPSVAFSCNSLRRRQRLQREVCLASSWSWET